MFREAVARIVFLNVVVMIASHPVLSGWRSRWGGVLFYFLFIYFILFVCFCFLLFLSFLPLPFFPLTCFFLFFSSHHSYFFSFDFFLSFNSLTPLFLFLFFFSLPFQLSFSTVFFSFFYFFRVVLELYVFVLHQRQSACVRWSRLRFCGDETLLFSLMPATPVRFISPRLYLLA